MHEASLVDGLLKIALKAAADFRARYPEKGEPKITEIICDAGLLSCFEEETIGACFGIFAEGTAAEGAELKISRTPLACVCETCGCEFELASRRFVCPECGGGEIAFSGGHGFTLRAVNIEYEDEDDRTYKSHS